MAASKTKMENAKVTYMGHEYEVSVPALRSAKLNRAMANAGRDMAAAYDAMDVMCCGKFDEYADMIPEADGTVQPYGASLDAMIAFLNAAAEQVLGAKN